MVDVSSYDIAAELINTLTVMIFRGIVQDWGSQYSVTNVRWLYKALIVLTGSSIQCFLKKVIIISIVIDVTMAPFSSFLFML